MENKLSIPTEVIDLPSKGLVYPEDSPLSSGKIEMKYMTAKEEDILTNPNYIRQGIVFDKLLQSLIVTPINYDDLLIGDKNAIILASRILAYGAKYQLTYDETENEVDLSSIEPKPLHPEFEKATENVFTFEMPNTRNIVTFKLLTQGDEHKISEELISLKKINREASPENTVRLSHTITSINGSTAVKDIREYVNTYLLAKDSRAFKKYYAEISPDLDLRVTLTNSLGEEEVAELPIGIDFFWPRD